MKRAFFKNLARDIKKTLSRFLSIVIIIAVGVAFYAGVRATSPDMKMSGDYYFNRNNFMDYRVISTLGLTEDDLSEISKINGVTKVQGAYSIDAVTERDGRSLVLNINSLPRDGINEIITAEGRKPENNTEAVVEDRFLEENGLKLGDTIELKSGNENKLEDSLNNCSFTIVGTAKSPLYISAQRQLSSVGNGSVRGFVYILPEVFKSEVYTEIYVRTEGEESKNSLLKNEEYNSRNEAVETALKDIGISRGDIRYAEVVKKGSDKLNEAEAELKSAKKEAEIKFADAYAKLNSGKRKLDKGKDELERNEAIFNQTILENERQLADGKNQIQSAEAEINSKLQEIEAGKAAIEKGKQELQDGESRLIAGKQQAAQGISYGFSMKLEEAKAEWEKDPLNPVLVAQYNAIRQVYENYIKDRDFDTMYSILKKDNMLDMVKPFFDMESLKLEEAKIAAGKEELANREKQLLEGEAKLIAGRDEIEGRKKELLDGEAKLNLARKEGEAKLLQAKTDLLKGEAELDKNAQKLKEEEAKANGKLQEGETEIEENRDKLNDIKRPEWYVLGRGTNVGYETYRQDSDRIDNIGKAFPLIFFLVASLVSLTTMTRMVQEKRIEIGTFKALGYSRGAIVSHYLIYSLSASIIGSLIGVSIGFRLFPPLIIKAYSSLYAIPYTVAPFNTSIALQASLIAVLFTAAAAAGATLEELREVPASLMRPKPPKSGKRIFLERITFVWKRLSFTRKVTARNIFRYKQRLLMTVIGIAACTSLMITGFGLKEGIIGATESQFNDIYKYNMNGSLSKVVAEDEKNAIKERAVKDANIESIIFTLSKNSSVKMEGSKSQDAYVVVPEDKTAMGDFINLTAKGEALRLGDDGVIITEKLSRIINKKPGDIIKITINDRDVEVKISAITRQYIQHYIYMSPEYYQSIVGEKPGYNSMLGLLKSTSEAAQENTSSHLKSIKNISSVGFKNNVKVDYDKSMNSVNFVVLVLIVSAGVLAFVVIYNLTNINISERKRELATIKLLGFFNNELASYIYRENMILTLIGSITGIFLGMVLNYYILLSAETNLIMFLNKINPIYFLYSVALTIVFSLIVNLAMYSRFDKIDMIESLKSAE